MITLHADHSPGELRVAAWDGARLADVAISHDSAADGVGDLHRGRIIARARAMAGAFVALDGMEGFLPDSEGAVGEGSILGLRITRAAQGGKGPRLSARLSPEEQALIGTGSPTLIRRGPDALGRLMALYPNAPVMRHAFPPELEDAWEDLASGFAALPGGARMSVHVTPALVAIDVDLGSASASRQAKIQAQTDSNRALIPELAHQLRLRNLSGAILVDLGGMPIKKRASLAPDFVRALSADPLNPRFLGFTGLGLAEILRPRLHKPLHELLSGPHALGLAALRRLCLQADAAPHEALRLRASPDVAQVLRADQAAQEAVFGRTGRQLEIVEFRDGALRCEIETANGP